ncbi:MAG: hypothetical protein KF746_27405 [Chitinophagaceae bacterium]|nr:hypothetical protein [Chitinophagaceae bacterium]
MEIEKIIVDYIEQPDTDFAILINGAWGSGKTYFLKNTMASKVKELEYEHPDKKKKTFYELVYISLYGVTSADELQRKLFLEINPIFKTKMGKISSLFVSKSLSYIGIDTNDKDVKVAVNIFGGIPKTKVLVFDDLERLETNTLNEVLGFINTYTEHQNLKVIIVADEQKIKDKLEDYTKVKEKLVRFTYHFHPELKEIYPFLAERYPSKQYKEFLNVNLNTVCSIFDRAKHKNIRTLHFVLDVFEQIYTATQSMTQLPEETEKYLHARFLYFAITYSIELKKGISSKQLESTRMFESNLDITHPNNWKFFEETIEPEAGPTEQVVKTKETTYNEYFEETYISCNDSNYQYFDFLADYINTGALDLEKLKEESTIINDKLQKNKNSPEKRAFIKLKNVLTLNDDEFNPLIEEIYGYVDAGKYPLEEYFKIFTELFLCSKNGLYGLKIDERDVKRFKSGMEKSMQGKSYQPYLKTHISSFLQADPLVIDIQQYAIELNNSLHADHDKALAEALVKKIAPGSTNELMEYIQQREFQLNSIFQNSYIDPDEVIERIRKLSNNEKLTVDDFFDKLHRRFLDNPNLLESELSFFEELRKRLDMIITALPAENKLLSTEVLIRLRYSIENLLIDMRKFCAGATKI